MPTFLRFALTGAIAIASFATPAMGAEPSTKLVSCGSESCLLITGERDDPAAIVSINGQPVSVEGKHSWRVRVPVAMVREWSAPHARTIEVALHEPETQRHTVAIADLPIGLLGNVTNLASLEVSIY
jgi:hypothetical protein